MRTDLANLRNSLNICKRGLDSNYCLKTLNFPFIPVRSVSLHHYLYCILPKSSVLPLVTIKHSTVLKPNIQHYDSGNSKATSSLGYILRQNAKLKEKYTTFIMWFLKIIHSSVRINKKRIWNKWKSNKTG